MNYYELVVKYLSSKLSRFKIIIYDCTYNIVT